LANFNKRKFGSHEMSINDIIPIKASGKQVSIVEVRMWCEIRCSEMITSDLRILSAKCDELGKKFFFLTQRSEFFVLKIKICMNLRWLYKNRDF
jgi:hypothetical protein